MACEYTRTCPFFNQRVDVSPNIIAMYRIRYCKGDQHDCARYVVAAAMGREAVPLDMHPTDQLRALGITRSHDGTPRPHMRPARSLR